MPPGVYMFFFLLRHAQDHLGLYQFDRSSKRRQCDEFNIFIVRYLLLLWIGYSIFVKRSSFANVVNTGLYSPSPIHVFAEFEQEPTRTC